MCEEQKQELEGTQAVSEKEQIQEPETEVSESSIETPDKKLTGKKQGILIAAAAVIIALAVGIGIYNTPANRLSRQLDLGQKYLLEQNYEQAIVEFDKAIAIDPMNVDAYLGKADAYIGLGDYDSAIETLKKGRQAIEEDAAIVDKLAEAYLGKAETYESAGDYDNTIRTLEEGYQATEKNGNIAEKLAEVYQELAEAYRQAGDLEAALEVLQRGYEMTGDERLQALILEIQDEIAARKAAEEARKRQEVLQTLKEQKEEIGKLHQAYWNFSRYLSYLTYEQLEELGKPIIELLETYKDVWMEDAGLINRCGFCLTEYYYAVGELEQCLELRGELYEKTGNDMFKPADGTDVLGANKVNGEASDRCIRNKYGQMVEAEGREGTGNSALQSCTYVMKCTYGEDGKMLTYEGEREQVLNQGSIIRESYIAYFQYDSYGRIEQSESVGTRGNVHYDYDSDTENYTYTSTYTYTEGGFTVHDINSSSNHGESESYRHYVVDEYGNATEQ